MTSDVSPSPTIRAGGLTERYAPGASEPDEMIAPGGALRPQWQTLVKSLDELGREEMVRRWDQALRLIRENGITHNVYGDEQGLARPWNLDLLPLPLEAAEWDALGQGLIQRARLLNALLADLYGPATCIQSGLLPQELIYANPGFLRPLHGVTPPRSLWLNLYAADLVRAADGRFMVLIDRTQAPSGAGYALENRIVLTRVLPTIFRQCNVFRLAPFFIAMRQALASLADKRDHPRVVLLTPGPYNETYFEHAYLARYLGYTLVQGKDLTVRDGRVYLKTLSGLQRVDVILRRVDDDFCDPLELFGGSYLGVPGLVQAVRDGTVAIANPLGTGVLQAPAFLPFFPGLCKHFLGEELRLHSAPTWWCGQAKERQYVLENLSRLLIKPAFPSSGSNPVFGNELSAAELEALAAKIKADPIHFIAQEQIVSHTVPIFSNDQPQSRRFVVRPFLAASEGTWTVMPGALTRVTPPDSLVVSLQKGGGSKDTWILSRGPVSEVTLLTPASRPVALSRGGGDLTSRVADDLFWLGRYVQRASSAVRLARCLFNRLWDETGIEQAATIDALATALLGRSGPRTPRELSVELFKPSDPSGLVAATHEVRALAGLLRDRISLDAWHILQRIDRKVIDFTGEVDDDHVAMVLGLLNELVEGFLAFGGMVGDSMTRGQAWRFLDTGLRLERALGGCRLIRATLSRNHLSESGQATAENSLLDALLDVADSALTYRRRYLTRLEPAAVADLLVADETNPRSVAFQIAEVEGHLASLPRESNQPQRGRAHQLAFELRMLLRCTDLRAVCQLENGRRPKLEELMGKLMLQLCSISDSVSQTYFSHAAASGTLESPQ